jgi:hypothetical protein
MRQHVNAFHCDRCGAVESLPPNTSIPQGWLGLHVVMTDQTRAALGVQLQADGDGYFDFCPRCISQLLERDGVFSVLLGRAG